MVARIKTGKNMLGALNYNENKVRQGRADCIAENLFGAKVEQLTFAAKRTRFEGQMALNRRSRTNVVHISLNFAVEENLVNDKLRQIAASYMERIGFGDQPFLVYNHFDAAHPHVHILTTSIQRSGKRIPLHNLGRVQSEKARHEIEKLFGLTRAQGRKLPDNPIPDIRAVEPANYGTSETKAAISNIVSAVTRSYKYTSIPELNAVLKQFNVIADRGPEGSKMFQKKGLIYSIIDSNGNKVGVPIKASSIYGKPTMMKLESLFKLNAALRMPYKAGLQQAILEIFKSNTKPTVGDFVSQLGRRNIIPVFRHSPDGRVYGITFVDHQNMVIFNGSDLGKEYAAKALMERLTGRIPGPLKSKPTAHPRITPLHPSPATGTSGDKYPSMESLKALMSPEMTNQAVEPSLIRKRRKTRRRKSI